MTYKIYKENKFSFIELDELKDAIRKRINSYKNRKEKVYYDNDHLWFWHDNVRKRIALLDIKKTQKAGLHGFGSMINIIYKSGKGFVENGKKVELHLVNVEGLKQTPSDLTKAINAKIEECNKRYHQGRKIHKFTGESAQNDT